MGRGNKKTRGFLVLAYTKIYAKFFWGKMWYFFYKGNGKREKGREKKKKGIYILNASFGYHRKISKYFLGKI